MPYNADEQSWDKAQAREKQLCALIISQREARVKSGMTFGRKCVATELLAEELDHRQKSAIR